MATITFKDRIKVVIGTMSWAEGLQLSKAFVEFVEHNTGEPDTTLNTIGAYFAMYAPHKVYIDGQLADDGKHTITIDDEAFTVTLPLTVEGFMTLPGPLVGDWIEAASEQNDWLLKRLDFMVSRITSLLSAPPPGSGLSSEVTAASAPTTMIG